MKVSNGKYSTRMSVNEWHSLVASANNILRTERAKEEGASLTVNLLLRTPGDRMFSPQRELSGETRGSKSYVMCNAAGNKQCMRQDNLVVIRVCE